METCAHVDPKRLHGLHDRRRALRRPRRAVERRKEAVARCVDLCAPVASEEPANCCVMTFDHVAPVTVAEPGRRLRRADDVGEQDRGECPVEDGLLVLHASHEALDRICHAVLVAQIRNVLPAGQRQVLGLGNALGEVAVVLRAVALSVQDQGRNVYRGEDLANVVS